MKSLKTKISQTAILSALLLLPFSSFALQIQNLGDIAVSNDFIVGPAKIETFVAGGEERVLSLSVTNRTGREHKFSVSVEDFEPSLDEERTVSLMGDKTGLRSLKHFVSIPTEEFTLSHGERALVPIVLSIPDGLEPGGRYGAVIVSMLPADGESPTGGVSAQARTISQIASLVFATVAGEIVYEGELSSFQTRNNQLFFAKSEIPFRLAFANEGTAHLNPYGLIVIRNIFGKEVGVVEIDPWFVLPESVRSREVSFEGKNLFGKYTAVAQINRGYGDVVDEIKINFFAVSFPGIAVLIALSALAAVFVRRLKNKKQA